MKLGLFVMTHKKIKNIFPKSRKIMMVGACNKDIPTGYLSDSVGNNISEKNPNFCELTGLYNIIYNDNDFDVIGLEHYRRLFFKSKKFLFKFNFLKAKEIEKILEDYDIIVPIKCIEKKTIGERYSETHYGSDLIVIEEIIKEKYPEYLEFYKKRINGHECYHFNMFIGKKEIIKGYSDWLFDILFEAEKRIDISKRDSYQARVFGFLSERMLGAYLDKNKEIKVCEKLVELMDCSPIKKQSKRLKNRICSIFKKPKKQKITINKG